MKQTALPGARQVVIVPIKAVSRAKSRLSHCLSDAERASLTRVMADDVLGAVTAVAGADVLVVAGCAFGIEVARRHGISAIADAAFQSNDLNGVIRAAVARLAELACERVAVVHADLPALRTETLEALLECPGAADVAIAADASETGSNIVAWRTGCGFEPGYGPGSFARHVALARELELSVEKFHDERAALDIDAPSDLLKFYQLRAALDKSHTLRYLNDQDIVHRIMRMAFETATGNAVASRSEFVG